MYSYHDNNYCPGALNGSVVGSLIFTLLKVMTMAVLSGLNNSIFLHNENGTLYCISYWSKKIEMAVDESA